MSHPLPIVALALLLSACAMQPVDTREPEKEQLQTRLDPEQQNAFLRDYAEVLSNAGNNQLAARILEQQRREHPADLQITRQIATVYERAGKQDLALLAWETIYRNTDTPLQDGAEYARMALLNQRYELARSVYRQWLTEASPGTSLYVTAMNNIGYSYLLEHNTAEARNWLDQALRQDPLNRKARANLELLQQLQPDGKRGGT